MTGRLRRSLPLLLALGVGLATILATASVWQTAVVPAKYFWLGFFAASFIAGGLVYWLLVWWPGNGVWRAVGSFLALVYIAAGLYAVWLSYAATGFLHATQVRYDPSVPFVLVAQKASGASDYSTVGFIQDETVTERAFRAFALQPTSYRVPANGLTSLLTGVATATTQAAVLRLAQWQLVQENNPALTSNLLVIKTVRVAVPVAKQTPSRPLQKNQPFVLYISGIDTYGDIATVSRSDVNILAAVNPKTHRIVLVTTPRDYYVQLHGTTGLKDKLTHAGVYGIDTSRQTLQDLYGVPIAHTLRVNFSSLVGLVDALGGVDIQSPNSFTAGGYRFTAGVNHVDGKAALAFSRERYAFSAGDRVRGENQERVIEAIVAKLNNPGNVLHAQSILRALEGTFQTSLGQDAITGLVRDQLSTLPQWSIQSLSVDGVGDSQPTYSMGNQRLYVMQPDPATVLRAQQAMREVLAQ
jgi:LCP family protein required for cell wall assembly